MYLVAQEMEPGSDEYNATFATAVRMFPDDPVANLNAANTALRLGDMKEPRLIWARREMLQKPSTHAAYTPPC